MMNTGSGSVNLTGWKCSACGVFVPSNGPMHYCGGNAPLSNLPNATPMWLNVTASGWLCPRCGVVNAPSVLRCSCPAPTTTTANTSASPSG